LAGAKLIGWKLHIQQSKAVKNIRNILVVALLTQLAFRGCGKREEAAEEVQPSVQREMASMIEELREQAVEPLPDNPGDGGRTWRRRYEEHMERMLKRRAEIIDRFATIGEAGVPVLIEAMDDNTPYLYVGRAAAEAIGKIGDTNSIPILENLVMKGNDSQRRAAADALGNLRSQRSVPVLEQALKEDTNQGVRLQAAVALGEIGARSAIEPLAARAADKQEDSSVRAYAVEALGKLKASAKLHVILAVFEESHKQSPGGILPEHCDFALRCITGEGVGSYCSSHPAPGQLDESVAAWRKWFEEVGKLKYPQN
jgi:hypothetical protein